MQRVLSTVVLLGLLSASAAAFAITEHLKLIKSPVYATHVTKVFSPVCECATRKAEIGFTLRQPDFVTVSIVGADGNIVDTIASHVGEGAHAVSFSWDGRTSSGTVAEEGTYQPEIDLSHARWTILMPNRITIDTTAPKVLSASESGGILISGAHSIAIDYVLSEKAHASVYVGGRRVILGRPGQPHAEVKWAGKAGGEPLPPGRYVLEVAAVDVAGNETPPAERKRVGVTIRAIALDQTSIRVAAGAHFTVGVRTGAPQYTWTFAGTHGTQETKMLRLRAPKRPGRYRLVVSADGHSASGLVLVGKK